MSFGAIIGGAAVLGGAYLSNKSANKRQDELPEKLAESQEAQIQAFLRNAPEIFGVQIDWAEPLAEAAAKGDITYQQLMAEANLKLRQDFDDDFLEQSLKSFDEANPGWRDAKGEYIQKVQQQLSLSPEERLDKRIQIDPVGEGLRAKGAGAVDANFALTDSKRAGGADQLLDQALQELSLGGELTDDVRREVEQATRRGQSSRGNIFGNAATYEEAMTTGLAGEARKKDRQGFAFDVLNSGLSADNVLQQDNQNDASLALGYLGSGQSSADTAYRDEQQATGNANAALYAPQAPVSTTPQFAGGYTGPNPADLAYQSGQQGAQAGMNAWKAGMENDPWQQVLGAVSGAGMQYLTNRYAG